MCRLLVVLCGFGRSLGLGLASLVGRTQVGSGELAPAVLLEITGIILSWRVTRLEV